VVAFTFDAQGVNGNASTGTGVRGTSNTGTGVQGQSDNGFDLFAGGGNKGWGEIHQQLWGFTRVPGLAVGSQLRDANGDMWLGTVAGSRLVATLAPGNKLGGSINLLPVAARLLDTRGGSPVAYHGTTQFQAGGAGGIPAGAVAVLGHVAAALRPGVNPGDGSSAILWPAGQTRPGAVNIVYNGGDLQGEYTGTLALVAIGAGGQISLFSQPINPVGVDYLFDCFGFVV
jgi:hypothetical protein